MKTNFELIKIFNEAKANIRNSPDYIQYEKIISNELLKKAEFADNTPFIVENVPYGIIEVLCKDFRNAGYNVRLLTSAISIGLNFS